jgi:5-methylcytosine-specific restriction protein B
MALSDVDFETFWCFKDESVREQLGEEFRLLKVHGALVPFHLHFGYRTMQECP